MYIYENSKYIYKYINTYMNTYIHICIYIYMHMATSRLLSVHNQSYADDVDLDNVLGPFWDPICLGPYFFNPVSISLK